MAQRMNKATVAAPGKLASTPAHCHSPMSYRRRRKALPTPQKSHVAMNVFVLNTGRCGSTTFAAACEHITNYSSGHETRSGLLGADRVAFAPNHIEVDNRLTWFLGRLQAAFGDDAYYVHLKRDDDAVARSFARRKSFGIMKAYRDGLLMGVSEMTPDIAVAEDYCQCVSENIEGFLRDKPNVMRMTLENMEQEFERFWHWINAQGDLAAALASFTDVKNASKATTGTSKNTPLRLRVTRKARRLVANLPTYLRDT